MEGRGAGHKGGGAGPQRRQAHIRVFSTRHLSPHHLLDSYSELRNQSLIAPPNLLPQLAGCRWLRDPRGKAGWPDVAPRPGPARAPAATAARPLGGRCVSRAGRAGGPEREGKEIMVPRGHGPEEEGGARPGRYVHYI